MRAQSMERKTDRRAALKMLTAAPVGLITATAMVEASLAQTVHAAPASQAVNGPIEPTAGSWHTWVLTSGSELRLPPPPDDAASRAELDELRTLASRRDAATLDRI